jgi:hypothetical protein
MSGQFFDWTEIEDDIVVPEQAAIAVYNNPNGGIVCRQAGRYGSDEDSWIFFHPSHALTLAKAILEKAGLDVAIVPITSLRIQNDGGEILAPFPDQQTIDAVDRAGRAAHLVDADHPETKPDKTAAERQRRRRRKQRQRDGVTETVTQRDAAATDRDIDGEAVTTAPLLPEFDLQNGGPRQTALAN